MPQTTALDRGGELLSTTQAAVIAKCTRETIQNYCRTGALPSTEYTFRKRPAYHIRFSDLMDWLASDAAPQSSGSKWSPDEDAALIELSMSCTDRQIARYLRRTVKSVRHRRHRLAAEGIDLGPRAPFMKGGGRPWIVPSTGILIAKTCPKCGLMRDADGFKYGNGANRSNFYTECRACSNAKWTQQQSESPSPSRAAYVALNEATKAQAFNEGKRYTDQDREVVADASKTELEVARELGRSWKSVCAQRYRMKVGRFGQRTNRTHYSHWTLDLSRDRQTIQNVFAELGRPVPEEFYEWSDTDLEKAS